MTDQRISFIGGGNMAQCLLQGLIAAGHEPAQLTASDPDASRRGAVRRLGARAVAANQEAVEAGDLVVLAVKPQVLPAVLSNIAAAPEKPFISICAGVPTASIGAATSAGQPIVRAMPNTPALLRAGVTALYANANVGAAQREAADAILSAVGKTFWVQDEAMLDAATAVSGSGPAYFFHLMEAIMEAGERLGLNADLAAALTVETAFGAALMARQGAEAPAALRRKVTSPGGTTESALAVLAERNLKPAVEEAVAAASRRSRQMAEEFARGMSRLAKRSRAAASGRRETLLVPPQR